MSPEATGTAARLRPRTGPLTPAEDAYMATVPYREAVGALWWLARCTRGDIFRACQQVACHVAAPAPEHWRAVRRIFSYLLRTKATPLVLRAGPTPLLTGHSDSDWAGCASTGRSQSGFIVRFGGALVSWRAIKQSDTAQSSCEAEYIAVNEVAKEANWWRGFLAEMGHPQPGPTPLFCDNKSTCRLARHSGHFEATKHIRHRYHYVRECCEREELIVHWISGVDQWADIFTKNCAVKHFRRIASFLLGSNV
jgi:hypothetical protein